MIEMKMSHDNKKKADSIKLQPFLGCSHRLKLLSPRAFNHIQLEAFNHSQLEAFNHSQLEAFNHSQLEAFNHRQIEAFNQID